MLKRNAKLTFSIKITANILKDTHIDFMGKRKIFYVISGILILISIGSLVIRGLNPGIDFTGGRTYIVQFDQPVKTADVAGRLTGGFGEAPQVVTFGNDKTGQNNNKIQNR